METIKNVTNANVTSRIKQWIILTTVITLGILLSEAASAQSFHKSKAQHFKGKYKSQIRLNDKACHILVKKRNKKESHQNTFASIFKRKPKYKPQAEVDGPLARN